MRYSVLIPVYNAEKYLAQCIESVLNQSCRDFELLLVNDGSTDGSAAICERYAVADNRVRYFSKQNEGMILSRRYLLRHAQGEYVLFLDADDYWDNNLLHIVSEALEKTSADIVIYRHRIVRENGEVIYESPRVFPENRLFDECTKMDFWDKFVSSNRLNPMWLKCMKRSVIDVDADYTQFDVTQGEDMLQSIPCLMKASTIYCINDVLVNYRLSATGHGRNFKIESIYDYEKVRSRVRELLDSLHAPKHVIRHFYVAYIEGLMQFVKAAPGVCPLQEYRSLLNEIRHWDNYKNAEKIVSVSMVSKVVALAYALLRSRQDKRLYWTMAARLWLKQFIKKLLMH